MVKSAILKNNMYILAGNIAKICGNKGIHNKHEIELFRSAVIGIQTLSFLRYRLWKKEGGN